MTRDEILKSYKIVGVAAPRKGQLIMTVRNCVKEAAYGGHDVVKVSTNWKNVFATILEKR